MSLAIIVILNLIQNYAGPVVTIDYGAKPITPDSETLGILK